MCRHVSHHYASSQCRGRQASDDHGFWTAGVANVIAHISSVMQAAGVQPGDRVLQWIAMYFDMTVLDFWTPLALGCAIVVAPAEEMKDVERVAALVQQHQIASISMVPSMCQVTLCSIDVMTSDIIGGCWIDSSCHTLPLSPAMIACDDGGRRSCPRSAARAAFCLACGT